MIKEDEGMGFLEFLLFNSDIQSLIKLPKKIQLAKREASIFQNGGGCSHQENFLTILETFELKNDFNSHHSIH